MFLIDDSLLGLSYDSLCETLKCELDEPKDWPYWGKDLKWVEYSHFEKPVVVFMFQNEKLCMIYNDQDNNSETEIYRAIETQFGLNLPVEVSNNCYFNAYMEPYIETGEYYFRQAYLSYDMEW